MRFLAFLVVILAPTIVWAAEETSLNSADVREEQSVHSERQFHLITFKCEPEGNEGAETTPQSPPLDVDDPGTPGCNTWEINFVADGDLSQTQNAWELPLLDLNYGIGDNLQLKYEVPYLDERSEGTTTAALGESKVGIKYAFFEEETSGLQLAVYPQRSFVSESAKAVTSGLVTSGSITTLPLLMTMKLGHLPKGDVNMTANIGYNASSKADTENYLSAALGVGAPLFRKVSILGEVSTEQAFESQADSGRQQLVKANLGAIGTLSKHFLLFTSLGHSLLSSDGVDHSYVLAGFRVLAGGT